MMNSRLNKIIDFCVRFIDILKGIALRSLRVLLGVLVLMLLSPQALFLFVSWGITLYLMQRVIADIKAAMQANWIAICGVASRQAS